MDARNTIDEDQEEEDSSKDRESSKNSRHTSHADGAEKPETATPPRDLADFLREANSFNRRGGGSPDGSADHGAAAYAWTEGAPNSDRERAVTGLAD